MTTDENTKPEDENEETGEEQEQETGEEQEQEETPDELKARLAKAEKAASRRENALRKAQEELAKLREEKDKPEGDADPVAKANARLIAASARTVLAAAGITDRDDQKAVIAALNLSDIEVDDEDGPDEEEIEERLSELRRIFGSTSKPERPGSRAPRGVRAPDRSKGETVDADTSRYRRIMGAR